MTQVNHIMRGFKKDLPFAAAAFLIWGGWAYYANMLAGFNTAMVSAFGQGTFSMTMTFLMGFLSAFFFVRMTHPLAQLMMPPVLISTMAFSCLSVIHYLIGTPNVFLTILPALIVGFLFCLFKTSQLRKEITS